MRAYLRSMRIRRTNSFVSLLSFSVKAYKSTRSNKFMSSGIIHLNHAGASPGPDTVLERVRQYTELEQLIGGYAAAATVASQLNTVYQDVANLIHAKSSSSSSSVDEIALVESATVAWTRLFYSLADYQERNRALREHQTKVIWISEVEYAANVVAACHWARTHDHWTVRRIPSVQRPDGGSTGVVDVDEFRRMLHGDDDDDGANESSKLVPALVCITHIPTNSGIVNPAQEIGSIISSYNERQSNRRCQSDPPSLFYLLDACQSVGQIDVNVKEIQCHGMAATGRKYLRGPRGTGFLYISESIVEHIFPHHLDHFGVPVTRVPASRDLVSQPHAPLEHSIDFAPRRGAQRFEFWESNIANRLGLGEAIRHANKIGIENISSRIKRLATGLYEKLLSIEGVRCHHVPSNGGRAANCGLVTFWIKGFESSAVKNQLDKLGFATSVVPATSTPLDSAIASVPDLVRVSVSYTNTMDEIELFCTKLSGIIRELR